MIEFTGPMYDVAWTVVVALALVAGYFWLRTRQPALTALIDLVVILMVPVIGPVAYLTLIRPRRVKALRA
jgi:hypothetical protein